MLRGLAFGVSSLGFTVWGFRSRVRGFRFRVWGFRFSVTGFGQRKWGFPEPSAGATADHLGRLGGVRVLDLSLPWLGVATINIYICVYIYNIHNHMYACMHVIM